MHCPDHDEAAVGACETCGREVCEFCLEDVDSPDDFECPECGDYGVALYDDPDIGEPSEDEEVSYDL